ncbi:hypothetical protein MMC17_002457 [Xylographa soralifera]|nr:hypothetical protein [Xylographa soralifera]
MPEPITMAIIALVLKKKLAVAGVKAVTASSHAAAAGGTMAVSTTIGNYLAAHAALVTAIAGATALSAILTGIVVSLVKFVEAGIKSKEEARRIMEGAKRMSERQQEKLHGELDDLLEKYNL